MRVLVLDSRNGNETSDLYVVDPDTRRVRTLQLNYSPEIAYDSATNQLLVVETELDVAKRGRGSLYWLKLYDARNLKLIRQAETPPRPMYAGFPNRSTKVVASASGRYVYFQVLQVHPERTDIYRVRPGRFDRVTNGIETGLPAIDSCVVDFGPAEGSEHELFFHLACDMPNTVAFMRFDSPEIDTVVVAELASRAFSLKETCGSWLDKSAKILYCVTREGCIYKVTKNPKNARLFCRMPLELPRTVPLHHIYGAAGFLFVGVALDDAERSVSLASEIWVVSIWDGTVVRVITITEPVINFVVDDSGDKLYGVNPYQRSLQFVDVASGALIELVTGIGATPCEVQLIP